MMRVNKRLPNFFMVMLIVTWREWIRFRRYMAWLIVHFLQPFLWVTLFVMFGYAFIGPQGNTILFTNYIVTGVSMLMFVSGMFWGSGLTLRREQWEGTLEFVFAAPINKLSLIIGYSIFDLISRMWFVGIAVIFGHFVFGFNPMIRDPIAFILIFVLSILSLMGFGIIFAGVTLLVKESNALINMLQPIIYLFCGIFFPVTSLPIFMQYISWCIPLTYSIMAVQEVVVFGATLSQVLNYVFILIGLTVFYFILGYLILCRIENIARRRGVLQTF